jgi:predicted nucleotidyltransferase
MSSTALARLSAGERALLDRYVEVLAGELGDELRAVWLFGSRARGEDTGDESDVDVLVLVDDDSWIRKERIRALLHSVAAELGVDDGWSFSIHVHTPVWLRDRRQIGSFFIGEVDRDKVVLVGRA